MTDWRSVVADPVFRAAVDAPVRVLSSRAELVDLHGDPVPVQVGKRAATWHLPVESATVAFRGETAQQWSADVTFTDPWMVITGPDHPLYPAQSLRVRLWWRIRVPYDPDPLYPSDDLHPADDLYPSSGSRAWRWMEVPVMTGYPQDPSSVDGGTVTTSMQIVDPLATARGGYGGEPLDLGGLNVAAALRSIFERCAPALPLRIAETDVVLPATYELDGTDPAQDWTRIADAAGWVVRTDREGVVTCGPHPTPTAGFDWAEGPGCAVSQMRRDLRTSLMGNRQTVRSAHPDHVGVWATVQDDDPSSPTWVGGPFGVRPLPDIESDVITTVEAATNLARMHLGRGLHPTEDVAVTIPQRPDLDYQTPIHLARAQLGVGGTYRVSSWSLSLPVAGEAPAPMTVAMMDRTVTW